MSSSVIVTDTITPELERMLREIGNRVSILRAVGQEIVSMTRQAFTNPGLRPESWAPLKKSTGRPLYRSGSLTRSIRVASVTNDAVMVSTDRAYAGFQQFGTKGPYTIRPRGSGALYWKGARHPVKSVQHPGLPPRPFFPFDSSGRVAAFARERITGIITAKLNQMLRVQ